jgi:thiamine-monophosphate kinase
LGIGDDAAVIKVKNRSPALVTTDMLMDGVHFDLVKDDPRLVGRKALAVNLSDIAAMAGRPTVAVVSVSLPRKGGRRIAVELFKGIQKLATEFGVSIAGGDTNSWNGPLVIAVTLLGEPTQKRPVLRSGAKPGDVIFVTGELGGTRLSKHLTFKPRIEEAQWLHKHFRVSAMIDISDGLVSDLGHILEESRCGAALRRKAIPVSKKKGVTLANALTDGEDFELCFTVPAKDSWRLAQLGKLPSGVKVAAIGTVISGEGIFWLEQAGSLTPVKAAVIGYRHEFD